MSENERGRSKFIRARVRVRSSFLRNESQSPIAGFEPSQDLPQCNQSEGFTLHQSRPAIRVRVRGRKLYASLG